VADDGGKQANGDAWGDAVAPERQAKLETLVRRQAERAAKPEAERGESAFNGVRLTGADVFWLVARTLAGTDEAQAVAVKMGQLRRAQNNGFLPFNLRLDALHLEGAALVGAHLERASLVGAHLERASLVGAHLERASLSVAHLERADLEGAHLERADLSVAHLEGASLVGAHLERADLEGAHLKRADLAGVHLEGAFLRGAHLEGAVLVGAHLEGHVYGLEPDEEADYQRVHQWAKAFPRTLPPSDLRDAFLDTATSLDGITLGTPGTGAGQGYVRVADVRWGGVNLAVVKDWPAKMVLGDEREAWTWQPPQRQEQDTAGQPTTAGKQVTRKERATARRQQEQEWQKQVAAAAQQRLALFQAAVRANRQLATALREQGMNEEADHFAYHAQGCQRRLFRLQRQWGRWFLQTMLAVLAGYGFRLWRILAAYSVVLFVFTVLYWVLGVHSFRGEAGAQALWDSFLVSLSAIHGRTVFEQLGAWTPAAWTAAVESVVGIVIEGVFVAMLVQRFIGGK
jgi:uncharacterized protein YjbI with pentapeptide repeats